MRLLGAVVLLAAAPLAVAANLLPNSGFEADADGNGIPDGWAVEIHTREGAEGTITRDDTVRHSGAASLRIDHTSDKGWVRASVFDLPAQPRTVYRFSAWVRGQGHYVIVLYQFTGRNKYTSINLAEGQATDSWQQIVRAFTTSDAVLSFKLSLITDRRATVWFDDVELDLLASVPSILVPTTPKAPKVDGTLSDECWKSAAKATVRFLLGGDGKLADVATQAMLVRDATTLFIAFRCEEPLAASLKARGSKTSSAWAQDRVEAYVSAGSGYCHYAVAASGALASERVVEGRRAFYPDWHNMPRSQGQATGRPRLSGSARIGARQWTAEMAIPLADIGKLNPAQPWRAQLCRVRLVSGEEEDFTWGYVPGERFASPDHFGVLAFEGPTPREPTLLTATDRPNVRPTIVPTPRRLKWGKGKLRLPRRMTIVLPAGASGRQLTGPRQLAQDLKRRWGIRTTIASGEKGPRPVVYVGWGRHRPPTVKPCKVEHAESYTLSVTPKAAVVVGADERGAYYGLQTLRQMVCGDEQGPFIPVCEVEDWPDTKWRGWHSASPYGPETIDDWQRVIEGWAALKYNVVVLEVNGRMKYDSYPDVGGGLSKQQMRDLVQFARDHYLEPIPQLATFGHFGYVLRRPEYAHLGERMKKPDGSWTHSDFNYCPSNPEVYKLVFALMDELIDVFQPMYFHIGHDEASFSGIGTCPQCSRKKPWQLWAEDIIRLHDHLKAKGCRTMLWAEQFLEHRNGGAPYYTARALPLVPRDMIMCHWQYSATKEQPDIKRLMDAGFEVLGCPWYWPHNVYYMASEVHRYGALGFLGTTWYGLDRALRERAWLQGAWVLGAENSWTVNHPDIDGIRYSTLATWRRIAYGLRRRAASRWLMVDIAPYCNETTVARDHAGWVGLGPDYDLRNLKPGIRWIDGVPVRILDGRSRPSCLMLCDRQTRQDYPARSWRIAIGEQVRALYFLHCTTIPDPRPAKMYDRRQPGRVGKYIITYEDGSQAEAELMYWRNIDDWNSQLGPAQACGVLNCHTSAGAWVTLGLWRWDNPEPDKKVAGVELVSSEGRARPILLALTAEL